MTEMVIRADAESPDQPERVTLIEIADVGAQGWPRWSMDHIRTGHSHPLDIWRRLWRDFGHTAFPRKGTSGAGLALGFLLASYVDFGPTDKNFAQSWVSQATLAKHLGAQPGAVGLLAREGHDAGWWDRQKRPNNAPWWTLTVPLSAPVFRSTESRIAVERDPRDGRFTESRNVRSTEATSSKTSSKTSTEDLTGSVHVASEAERVGTPNSFEDTKVYVRLPSGACMWVDQTTYESRADLELVDTA